MTNTEEEAKNVKVKLRIWSVGELGYRDTKFCLSRIYKFEEWSPRILA